MRGMGGSSVGPTDSTEFDQSVTIDELGLHQVLSARAVCVSPSDQCYHRSTICALTERPKLNIYSRPKLSQFHVSD